MFTFPTKNGMSNTIASSYDNHEEYFQKNKNVTSKKVELHESKIFAQKFE